MLKNFLQKVDESRYAGIFYVFCSSVLTSLSFAPWYLWPLSFVCLIPVMYHLEKSSYNKKTTLKLMGLASLLGILVSIYSFHWVTHTMVVFGHLPWSAAITIFILYAVGTNTRWLIFFGIYYFYQRKMRPALGNHRLENKPSNWLHRLLRNHYFMAVGCWAVAEFFGWQLFPYYGANLASGNIIFLQITDALGTYGASLIWFWIMYSFYLGFKNRKIPVPGIALFIICHIYGGLSYWYWSEKQKTYPKYNIGVVQGHTPLGFKGNRNLRSLANEYLDKMIYLSREMVRTAQAEDKKLDLIVWPESSVPYVGYYFFEEFRDKLQAFQNENPVEFFISDLLTLYKNNKRLSYNNVFLLSKEGNVRENYQKVKLLPFGEYLPLSDYFPAYKKAFREVSGFTKGTKFRLFPAEVGRIMPLVCYEIIVPEFVSHFHEQTSQKAQIFVNVTNDTWFGDSVESGQHMELARPRSIEYRLPIVRGVNSGITTWFDITGRNFEETELMTRANKIYTVPIPPKENSPRTIYAWFGAYLHPVFLAFFTLIYSLGIFYLRKIKS